MAGNYKFWYIEDKSVAKTLGIDTSKGTTGDIYIVRAADPNFTSSKPTSNIFGFKFSSEILMAGPEVQATPDEAVKKLQELSFNNPIVVNDEVKFRKMLLGLPTLLVYCDPNIHGQDTYDRVMRSVSEARKKMPLIVDYAKDRTAEDTPEVMFVVSKTNKLPPIGMLKKDQPMALFIKMGRASQVDILKEYLPAIKKIEGLPVEKFKEKAANAEKEFAPAQGDDEATTNEKQHQGIVFNESRFEMQALHSEKDLKTLMDPDSLITFVKESLSGTRPYFWLSENPKKDKSSTKVVGDSFKAHVFDTKRDALVLVYHPIAHKNRGLKDKFEAFAKSVDSENLLVARLNGVNESAVFKCPAKLPAIVHFTRAEIEGEEASPTEEGAVDAPFGSATSRVKESTEYQFIRNHMAQSSTVEEFKSAMADFIRQQTPDAKVFKKN